MRESCVTTMSVPSRPLARSCCDPQVAAIDAAQLSGCRDLSALQLSRNRLAAWPLPAEPGAMPALQSLSMAFNPIRSAPPGAFASCAATLRVLDMSGGLAAAAREEGGAVAMHGDGR